MDGGILFFLCSYALRVCLFSFQKMRVVMRFIDGLEPDILKIFCNSLSSCVLLMVVVGVLSRISLPEFETYTSRCFSLTELPFILAI